MGDHQGLHAFLKGLTSAVRNQDGHLLGRYLSLDPDKLPAAGGGRSLATFLQSVDIDSAVKDRNGLGDFAPAVCLSLSAAASAAAGDWDAAVEKYQSAYTKFAEGPFRSDPSNWAMPALQAMTKEVRAGAKKADESTQGGSAEESDKHVRGCANVVQVGFKVCCGDKNGDWGTSKKPGALFMANQMIMLYFQLNTLKNCRNTIATLDRSLFSKQNPAPPHVLKKGDLVTYKFYLGRLKLFEDQYDEAEEALRVALKHCHRGAVRNRRRILSYLVPLELHEGRLPTLGLLQKHELCEYEPIVRAVRKGDLRLFDATMKLYMESFIRRGTFLLLEKVRTIVVRNVLKRVHLVCGVQLKGGKSCSLDLAHVQKGFELNGIQMDLDEIESHQGLPQS
jgi:hypothetical protein